VMNQAQRKQTRRSRLLLFLIPILLAVCLLACPLSYTFAVLSLARGQGVYASPQAGVAALAQKNHPTYPNLEILNAGPIRLDGSSAHIWYITWRACLAANTLGDRPDCLGGGNYYIHARDGWIFVGEGYFPELLGFFMQILGLSAPE
jgi:hypothetical protein